MQNNDNNFLDSKTLTAIVLVGAVWFGWQMYLSKKYPNQGANAKVTQVQTVKEEAASAPAATTAPTTTLQSPTTETAAAAPIVESTFEIQARELAFKISSKGMGLKDVTLNTFKDTAGTQIKFYNSEVGIYSLALDGKVLDFNLEKIDELNYLGIALVDGLKVERRISFNPETYSMSNKINVVGSMGTKQLEILVNDTKREFGSGHFLFPSYEFQEFYVLHEAEKTERVNITHAKEPISANYKLAKLASIDSHYFTTGVVDRSETIPEVHTSASGKDITLKLIYGAAPGAEGIQSDFTAYIGPRDLSILQKVDPALAGLVNFGFFSVIAKPLWQTMRWFYSVVGNWGIAIILLTLLVRMIVLPLHIMSFKSMKAMQRVQPLINSLREKYKDDPTTLNREMMDLMRQHKVNPLGGCLPMLLQIPVFFALYQVFGQSIELYQAPFGLWITDLSLKDPFYILPVLMAVMMFIQQKITPTTMDPTQAKIMAFMPILFSVFMLSLPSALTLYMFVSTLFGIIQQYLFLKEKTAATAIKEAKA